MAWDVMVGVARRAWARNPNAVRTAQTYNRKNAATDRITLPYVAEDGLIQDLINR
jgi:urocanate hydratase